MPLKRSLWVGILAISALGHASDRDFTIQAESLFMGTNSPARVQPFIVTVENKGRDVRGVVNVRTNDFTMDYPIDLPQGSRKRFIAYVNTRYSVEGMVSLRTPNGGAEFRIETAPSAQTTCFAAVTDAAGEFGFLRSRTGQQNPIADLYLKPDMMPERTSGYAGIQTVFLAEGSERMNDEAFRALKMYIVAGGNVVMFGGASMPLQGDPRWRPLLPVVDARPKTVRLDNVFHDMQAVGDTTLGIGRLAPGAHVLLGSESTPYLVELRYGLGRVLFIAMNLTEGPAKGWVGREKFVEQAGILESPKFGQILDACLPDVMNPFGAPSAVAMPGTGAPVPTNDPFSATVPDTTTVLLILFIYLILVVPVNLLILRKIGKGEWAWITSPIISLGFAAVFFRYSAGLYAADLSLASTGALIVREGEPEGYYLGRSQLFFPRGGTYDLGLERVEAIFPSTSARRGMSQMTESLGSVDLGQVSARPNVTNLSFREFSYLQRIPTKQWLQVRVQTRQGAPVGVSVVNRSNQTLTDVGVLLKGVAFSVGQIAPGETKSSTEKGYEMMDSLVDMANAEAETGRQGVLVGLMPQLKPGPQIGAIVPTYQRNWLLYTFPWSKP